MPQSAFEEAYAEVANMKLLQAHLIQVDQSAGTAEVFVEEERTIVRRTGTNEQVPTVAWYTGTVLLKKNSAGSGRSIPYELGLSVLLHHSAWVLYKILSLED